MGQRSPPVGAPRTSPFGWWSRAWSRWWNRLDQALLLAASEGGALDLLADYASFPGGQAAGDG